MPSLETTQQKEDIHKSHCLCHRNGEKKNAVGNDRCTNMRIQTRMGGNTDFDLLEETDYNIELLRHSVDQNLFRDEIELLLLKILYSL